MNKRLPGPLEISCAVLIVASLLFPAIVAADGGWPQLQTVSILTGINQPVHVTGAGDGSGRLFVVERGGRILVVRNPQDSPTVFLDIREDVGSGSGEQGLLSVAFPPDYHNDRFYVDYTNTAGDTVVARYHVTGDPDAADPDGAEVLMTIDQPFRNHNGGQLAFGPDGYLYVGMGDGGSRGDPGDRAQNPGELLGKLLRIDVESGASPYAVPPDNPFVGVEGARPEIWALGLRNPWRFSFDTETGELYMGDVGQVSYEEIDVQTADSAGGENYGWRLLEANHCYDPPSDCLLPVGYHAPVLELGHADGWNSVTGGFVYRGTSYLGMRGIYLFADYRNGEIWGLRRSTAGWESTRLLSTGHLISTFGQDDRGDLYVADYAGGVIYRIVDLAATPTSTITTTLTPVVTALPSKTETLEFTPTGTPTGTPQAGATPTATWWPVRLPLLLKM